MQKFWQQKCCSFQSVYIYISFFAKCHVKKKKRKNEKIEIGRSFDHGLNVWRMYASPH